MAGPSLLERIFGSHKPKQPTAEEWRERQKAIERERQASQPKPTPPPPTKEDTIGQAHWYPLNSSNADRTRYHAPTQTLQVIFKNGALYQYRQVPPEVFKEFLNTHSPGKFVWYVLRAFGFPYDKLGEGYSVSEPAAPRFDEQPFAVPAHLEKYNIAGSEPDAGNHPGLWGPVGTSVGKRPPPV